MHLTTSLGLQIAPVGLSADSEHTILHLLSSTNPTGAISRLKLPVHD